MVGLGVLDVGIGLIFLYLLLSLMCTALSEIFAGLFNRRGEKLLAGIRQLLHDGPEGRLAREFYGHPLITTLTERGRRPSYIPSRTFAAVVLDLLAPSRPGQTRSPEELQSALATLPEGSVVRGSLQVLWQEANQDLRAFEGQIESWFEATMERVSGWYKRHLQTVVLVIAIILSAGTNADTISVATALSNDSALREILVARATAVAARSQARFPSQAGAPPSSTSSARADSINISTLTRELTELRNLGLPLGWTAVPTPRELPGKVLGLLLTALALTLGAPFWFDVLSKIISVRGAGVRPGEHPKGQRKKDNAARASGIA